METKNNAKERDRKRGKAALDMNSLVYGKVPPQAKDLE